MSTATLKNRIENLIATAHLLERVDANPALIGAAQYRSLSAKLTALLGDEGLPADALRGVLQAFPATALLYENLHYPHSGLSQAPLDLAVSSEQQASALLTKLRRGAQPAH